MSYKSYILTVEICRANKLSTIFTFTQFHWGKQDHLMISGCSTGSPVATSAICEGRCTGRDWCTTTLCSA